MEQEQAPSQQATRKRNRTAPPAQEAAPPAAETSTAPVAAAEPPAEKPPVVMSRPPIRTNLRDADPRAAAEARAAELLDHLGTMDEGTDEFKIDKSIIPDGWDYNWKRKTVHGMEDPAYQVALARTGWEAVPASRHPEMMPADWKGATIERKGQVLMERPLTISTMVKERDDRAARNQVVVKEAQLNSAPQGQMPRSGDGIDPRAAAGIAPRISKGYEPMQVPKK